MILPILVAPNDVLTTPTRKVEVIDDAVKKLVADMRETMHNADGLGIAAPQVGSNLRICVLEFNDPYEEDSFPFTVLINPRITWTSIITSTDEEACLSLPTLIGPVKRPREVRVKALDLDGNEVQIRAKGLFGRAIQHEIDHLDGVLFTDKVPKGKVSTRKKVVEYPTL